MSHPETEICAAIERVLKAGVPDVQERVLQSAVIPTDKRYWPCLLVNAGDTDIETSEAGSPGRRVQVRHCVVSIHVVDDGDAEDIAARLRAVGLAVETALMADPHLKEGGPPRAANIVLAQTSTDVVIQRGAVMGVRRLDYVVTYHTREMNPSETLSRQH